MKYLELTDLPELTQAADCAQGYLNTMLADYAGLPKANFDLRLHALDKITDFIYRLTAVRKTLAALRASFEVNTDGLRALTTTLRTLHEQMQSLGIQFRKASPGLPKPPADWDLKFKRFAPDWPPTEDELIPEPSLPQSGSGVPPLMNPAAAPASADEVAQAFQPAHERAPQGATLDGQAAAPAAPAADSDPRSPQPDPLTTLLARIPSSITNPNFELPEESNNANDYAPLLGMDLVPFARTIPTLPLASPDLKAHFRTQDGHFTDTYVNLRADIMKQHPQALTITPAQRAYYEQNGFSDAADQPIPADPSPNSNPDSSRITPHSSLPNPPDPNALSP